MIGLVHIIYKRDYEIALEIKCHFLSSGIIVLDGCFM